MELIPAKNFGYSDKIPNPITALRWIGEWHFKHYNKDGKLIWEDIAKNDLAQEGGQSILDSYLRNQNHPPTFYLRLYNDTPLKTDALSDLQNEASGNGYVAAEIPRSTSGWIALALDAGDYQATSSEETFSASGGSWGPVTYAVLATTSDNSGKHIAFVALSQTRTLQDGETLKVTLKIKQA